jgi:hypothetical protein
MVHKQILLYGLINAPSVPEWMLQEARDLSTQGKNSDRVINNHGDDFTRRTLYKNGQAYTNSFNWSSMMSDHSLAWVRSNVAANAKDVRSVNTTPGLERNGAHCDRSRVMTMIYLIDSGGADHQTVFYREKGVTDLIRLAGTHVDNYNGLEQLASVRLQLNRWNLLYGKVLHSIENIPQGRFSIQVSLDELPDNLSVDMGLYI